MRNKYADTKTDAKKNLAFGLFVRRAVRAVRRDNGQLMAALMVPGYDIRAIRRALGESQRVFAARFCRDERQIRRWEVDGYSFTDRKPDAYLCRYSYREIWELTCCEACEVMRLFGYAK